MKHTLDTLIAFLQDKPAEQRYSYTDTCNCLMGQYFRSTEPTFRSCGGTHWTDKDGEQHDFPLGYEQIALYGERTFGAAFQRTLMLRSVLRSIPHAQD